MFAFNSSEPEVILSAKTQQLLGLQFDKESDKKERCIALRYISYLRGTME